MTPDKTVTPSGLFTSGWDTAPVMPNSRAQDGGLEEQVRHGVKVWHGVMARGGTGSGLIAPGEALGRGKHDVDAPRHRERNLPIRTQRVESRPAKGRATSRKRVLRGVWVTSAAKRRQRACRPLRSSSEKTTSRRPTPLRQRKAASCSRSGLAARLLRGLRTVACTHWGSSGNLGGPVVSVETNRFSGSGRKVQADARRCP